ncbi:MAG TPA: sulfatase [Acidimicrobiia bacterium]|nr:sulfatase [Acidimicrobiia bacterium]
MVPVRWVVALLLAVLAAVGLVACGDDDGTAAGRPSTTAPADQPNVVVVMTDDQTVESVRVMEAVRERIGEAGTTFTRAYASYPLCCPSRASFLTGQYAHNHGVRDNVPPVGGFSRLEGDETIAVWLQRAGYRTVHVGKYLNQYGKDNPPVAPPGWEEWFGLVDPSTYQYFNYWMSTRLGPRQYGEEEGDYQTDVLADIAVERIERFAEDDRPFFLSVAPLAPHSTGRIDADEGLTNMPPVPAPRHAGRFDGEPLPASPAFDEEDVGDKPRFVQDLPRIDDAERARLTEWYQAELESLLAVDEAVGRILDALEELEILDETIVVFTSDNGFLHGEHRLVEDKRFLYEPAAGVPLLVRGPGFEAATTVDTPVANIDLAPTFLAAAGARAGIPVDGVSLVDADAQADRAVFLDNRNDGPRVQTTGIVTTRYTYFEHSTGERELYDLGTDPHQLENLAGSDAVADVEADLAERLERLRRCAGRICTQ